MANTYDKNDIATAEVDFECLRAECSATVKFNLIDAVHENFQVICPACHNSYRFDSELSGKLVKLCDMIVAIRKAEDILGDCNVAVTIPGRTVKIPYALLLTRLNTMVTLQFGDRKVDFHFRVEPTSPETFR
jgi:hypothetical protein